MVAGLLELSLAPKMSAQPMPALPDIRVLIVEDELLVALDVEMALIDAGHDVVGTAATEREAVEMALRLRPDVMLVDLRLANGGCGRSVAEKVLAEIEVAVIFASGNLSPEMQRRLACLEPVAMIGKPYLDSQLLGAVQLVA